MQFFPSDSWKNNNALEVYKTYLALKRHFTSSYDYFKFNGKVKVSLQSFERRKDVVWFDALSKHKEWKELLIANLMINPNIWIGDLVSSEAEQILLLSKKRKTSLFYTFSEEIKKLQKPFDQNFIPLDGQHPITLKMFIEGSLSIETMIILEELIHYVKVWDKRINDPIIWPKKKMMIVKSAPFIEINNLDKFRKKVVDIFSDM